MKEIQKIYRSVQYAIKGLRHAYSSDKSFRMEIQYGLPIYLGFAWYLAPFQPWEIIVYTFSYIFILVIELVNTAFEKMLDRLHPEQHELIGKSKDIASAAVLMAFLFALLVVVALLSMRVHNSVVTPIPFQLPYA